MGAHHVKESRGGVHFGGDLETAYRACLWTRLANRILLPLADFAAPSTDALYQGVKAINWSAHLNAEQTIAVDTNLSNSGITHSHFASLRVKDAIVDYFQESQGLRPNVDRDAPDIRINCYISANQASLYLDLSGTSLHQRNYRLDAGPAPLKENLAAAILLRSRWHETAAAQGAFIDLMCGSGTLVIEAALMAADIAPGLTRQHWGLVNWQQHRQSIWQRLTAEAQYRRDKGLKGLPVILGFDNNRRVLEQARANADRAGLSHKIQFAYQDIFTFRHDLPTHGLMVSNPPYGKRLAESGELPALYKALGALIKAQLVGWKAAIFTEDPALGKHMGLRAEKLHTLYNGALACKLIQFDIDKSRFYRDDRLPRILEPDEIEEALGYAEVRQQFKIPKLGVIAGCYVTKGKVVRNAMLRVSRDNEIIHKGRLTSLKRFKDDTTEVLENYECGIGVDGFFDFNENDIIEVYEIKEVKRTLS